MTDFQPRWRYHATQGAKLIATEAALDEASAQGWADSPAAALEAVDIDRARGLEAEPDDGVVVAITKKRTKR